MTLSDAERAALHKTMFSYSGKYRVEGDMFITTVDVSWNEAWNGTEQKRHYRLEGDKLLVDTTRQPSVLYPGKTTVGRLVWERENRRGLHLDERLAHPDQSYSVTSAQWGSMASCRSGWARAIAPVVPVTGSSSRTRKHRR